ncbi:MAG: hypothetical protein M1285_05550 [Candidatus Thermoplasmatota archaeon]|nr:hypothetical protein [Candidatus Thermoplasmatota archaeon]
MQENDLTEDEAYQAIQEKRMEIEGKKIWRQCRIADREALIPDTTLSLGHDVYGVSSFECHVPDPNLVVNAFPLKYIGNIKLERAFARRMKFSELSPDMIPIPGVIEGSEVRIPKEKR